MSSGFSEYLQVFKNRRIGIMLLLGFSSGLPLALISGTLQAWMAVEGVDLKTIGIFALVGTPYAIKFLWSPFMDRFVPPWLGRRRGWIITTQLLLMLGIAAMAFLSPKDSPFIVAALAVWVAFTSASQDVVVDAYRTDILKEQERGVGAAVFVTGYRVAMLVSGALAMILSERIGWRTTYLLMAGLMVIGMLTSLFAPEPEVKVLPPKSIREAVWGPLKDFFARRSALLLLLLIVLYKLCDAYAGSMTTVFLIRGMGFTAGEVGTVNKGFGLVALIVGATFGGALMVRLGQFRSLLYFGILQAVSILSMTVLAWIGKSYSVMILAVGLENITGGMGTAAFVALLMALCNQRYSATQYALLSSLASLGRIFIAPSSGFLAAAVGWPLFFIIATLTALPGLIMLIALKKEIAQISK
jgi:PAT family beta-lactamase induction signal transducer AmpG